MPTLAAAAGGEAPPGCDGQNLLALLQGEAPTRHYLEAAHPAGACCALTDGRWKYFFYPEGGQEQLFDLESDPHELTDLARQPQHDEKRRELREELTRRHIARGSDAVADGQLIEKPLRGDSTASRRARSWPGYHTEHFEVDVRH